MKEIPSELLSVMDEIRRDKSLWCKVASMDGAQFVVKFGCNSQVLRRTLVQQSGESVIFDGPMEQASEMPRELEDILDRCENDLSLLKRVAAFERGKFNIECKCSGFACRTVFVVEVS